MPQVSATTQLNGLWYSFELIRRLNLRPNKILEFDILFKYLNSRIKIQARQKSRVKRARFTSLDGTIDRDRVTIGVFHTNNKQIWRISIRSSAMVIHKETIISKITHCIRVQGQTRSESIRHRTLITKKKVKNRRGNNNFSQSGYN